MILAFVEMPIWKTFVLLHLLTVFVKSHLPHGKSSMPS